MNTPVLAPRRWRSHLAVLEPGGRGWGPGGGASSFPWAIQSVWCLGLGWRGGGGVHLRRFLVEHFNHGWFLFLLHYGSCTDMPSEER